MKVKMSAWSERYKGITHYCVAVKNDCGLYKIFEGKSRSNQTAYELALKQAYDFIKEQSYELEAQS